MNELNFSLAMGWIAGLLAIAWLWYSGPQETADPQQIMTETQELADGQVWEDDFEYDGGLLDNAELHVNQAGLSIIKTHERLELQAYRGFDGGFQIGYGHGADVVEGQIVTIEEAEEFLIEDLEEVENAIRAAVTVPLNDNEFSSLVSFSFSLGTSAFWSSTVLQHLNEGDRVAAADAFLMWNKATQDGQLVEDMALTERRNEERELFLLPPSD
jgi:lysozyme